MKKKKDDKIQQVINYTVVIVLSIVCTFSYCQQQKELEISDITMCKIIDVYRRPGTGLAKSKLAVVEYYVSGKRFECDVFFNSKYSNGVGDCFWLEYSVNNPKTFNVLWDKGKQNCNCLK